MRRAFVRDSLVILPFTFISHWYHCNPSRSKWNDASVNFSESSIWLYERKNKNCCTWWIHPLGSFVRSQKINLCIPCLNGTACVQILRICRSTWLFLVELTNRNLLLDSCNPWGEMFMSMAANKSRIWFNACDCFNNTWDCSSKLALSWSSSVYSIPVILCLPFPQKNVCYDTTDTNLQWKLRTTTKM